MVNACAIYERKMLMLTVICRQIINEPRLVNGRTASPSDGEAEGGEAPHTNEAQTGT
jgi:hypothetical protein